LEKFGGLLYMDQFLNCGICAEGYSSVRIPMILQCGHTFCSVCVERINSCHSTLKCPIDRQVDYRGLSEIRPNIILSQLVDYHSTSPIPKCKLHPNKISKFLCFDCNSQFCSRCIHSHIFHKWIEFFPDDKIFQYFNSRKAYLESTKKIFEDKFQIWAQSKRELVEKQGRIIEEVKARYREKKESLRIEENLVIKKIEENSEKSKGVIDDGMRIMKDSIWKILDLLNIQLQGGQEALIYETECQKIQNILQWIDSPGAERADLFSLI